MKKIIFLCFSIILGFQLTACARNLSPNNYQASEVGVASKAVPGVIVSKRLVNIDGNTGVGAMAGAVSGGAMGSMIGGNTAVNVLGAVGGALLGGVAGNAIDKNMNQQTGIEYIIKLNKGGAVSVTQPMDTVFEVHQHVMVIYGPRTRIIPDTTRLS